MAKIRRVNSGKALAMAFKDFVDDVKDEKLLKYVEDAADLIANEIRSRAPGRLKQVIRSYKFGKQRPGQPAAFVAIDRKRKIGGDTIGRVAHLVERGHGGPKAAAAHPFFLPAVKATSYRARKIIQNGIKKVLQGATS